ncbi:hypothetical protein ACUY2R_10540 [Corynebacterium mastitidis]
MEHEGKQGEEVARYDYATDNYYLGDLPFSEPVSILQPPPQSITPPDEEDYDFLRNWLQEEEKPSPDEYIASVQENIAFHQWLDVRMDRGLLVLGRHTALEYFEKAKDLYRIATGIQIEDELDLINFC